MASYILDIRQRRQATFPNEVLKQLGIGVGDSLEIEVLDKKAIIRPRRQVALDALKEIQEIFKDSGVEEKEFQNV